MDTGCLGTDTECRLCLPEDAQLGQSSLSRGGGAVGRGGDRGDLGLAPHIPVGLLLPEI